MYNLNTFSETSLQVEEAYFQTVFEVIHYTLFEVTLNINLIIFKN